jgi:hypothetical protein
VEFNHDFRNTRFRKHIHECIEPLFEALSSVEGISIEHLLRNILALSSSLAIICRKHIVLLRLMISRLIEAGCLFLGGGCK